MKTTMISPLVILGGLAPGCEKGLFLENHCDGIWHSENTLKGRSVVIRTVIFFFQW